MRNLHHRFVLSSNGQIYGRDFAKFCGLLRIYELYTKRSLVISFLRYFYLAVLKHSSISFESFQMNVIKCFNESNNIIIDPFHSQDVCGIFCAILTWMLIFYANFVVFNVVLIPFIHTPYSIINTILFTTVSTLAVASHLRTMLSDPVCKLYFKGLSDLEMCWNSFAHPAKICCEN